MAELRKVEIFAPGTWNGQSYTNGDMIEMVNNSNRARGEFRALLSLNHDEVAPKAVEEAAFGVVVRYYLRKFADGLLHVFADFENVPQQILEVIQFYPNRSIDLYPTFKTKNGEILRNVIACVSFLGSKMPPAVKGMMPDFVMSYHHDSALLALQGGRKTFNHPFYSWAAARRGKQDPIMRKKQYQDAAALGKMLAQKRAELGATEAEVAEIVGVSAQTILDLESGNVLPGEVILEKLAKAYQIEVDALKPPKPEEPEVIEEQDGEEDEEDEVIEEQDGEEDEEEDEEVKAQMADLHKKIQQIERERDAERRAREHAELQHFFEKLETRDCAGKILTGKRVREFAEQLSASEKMSFSEGAEKQQSPRAAFLSYLEMLANSKLFKVPTGQISNPAAQQFADQVSEARTLIQQYQDQHKCEYLEARLAIKSQRPELFRED